jgi:hypothetical protein
MVEGRNCEYKTVEWKNYADVVEMSLLSGLKVDEVIVVFSS